MKKILLCDDDEGILDVVSIVLKEKDCEVIPLSDCENIISKVNDYAPDLIMMDLWMPTMSGDKIIKKLKSNKATKEIPVIIFSATKDTKKISKKIGADGYLLKPFDISELEELVLSFVTKRSKQD